jgi:exportin-5
MKIGFPSQTECPAAIFSTMDFDSDEEFSAFFHRYRAELQDAIHQATLIAPLEAFAYIEKCLVLQLSKPVVGMCTPQSPDAVEWEALNHVVEAVLSRILLCRDRPPVSSGLRLLQMCLNYETSDPLLASFVLSSISALFVFLSMDPSGTTMLPLVMHKIFAALVFTQPGQTKESRSRAVKNVRRHAASLMVKLAQRYPLLLLPMFDDICATVRKLSQDPDQLSQLERVTLQEALLLVSNHFCDYERQTAFVAEVIAAGSQQWLAMKDAFATTENFMAFVGLDKPPVEPSSDDVNGKNRSQIMLCMKLFFAIARRCAWPDDPERLSKGGFVAGYTPSGNPIHRNPAAPHLLPLLPHLMALCRTLNALWQPKALERLSEGYKKAHDMLEVTCILYTLCVFFNIKYKYFH